MQQDLALASLLGIGHVERNAHHFIDGFGARPDAEARAFLRAHPDLYHEQDGRVRLRLHDGRLALGSLQCAGFGTTVTPELANTPRMPPAAWPPAAAALAAAAPALAPPAAAPPAAASPAVRPGKPSAGQA